MSRFDGMTVNERLFEAKLDKHYSKAAREQDAAELRRILKAVEIEGESAERVIVWEFGSPFSSNNRQPITLSPELPRDPRIARLSAKGQRIAQHFFDEQGGLGSKQCVRQDCAQIAPFAPWIRIETFERERLATEREDRRSFWASNGQASRPAGA